MNFEDELRETMRAHDAEAPAADGLTVPAARPARRAWLPAAAAALVVVAVAGTWFAIARSTGSSQHPVAAPGTGTLGTPTQAPSPPDCPASYAGTATELTVPQEPDGVPDATDRLAPDQIPTSLEVCAYLQGAVGLTGTRTLTGDLSTVPGTLSFLPAETPAGHACTQELLPTDSDKYLIALTYGDGGLVWVAAPGDHCAGASNGLFRTSANLLQFVAPAYQQGLWPGLPPYDPTKPCDAPYLGRSGDDLELVPGNPVSLSVCESSQNGPPRARTTSDLTELQDALNALPTQSSDNGCTGGPGDTTYELVFRYAVGPPVRLWFAPACRPSVLGDNLEADAGSDVLDLVQRLLG